MIIFIIILLIILFIFVVKKHEQNHCKEKRNSGVSIHKEKTCNEERVIKQTILYNDEIEYKDNLKKAEKEYLISIKNYETIISSFNYEIIQINDNERLYVIEKELIVYLGISTWNGYGNPDIPFPHVFLEELTPNKLFKFVISKVHEATNMHVHYFRGIKFQGIVHKHFLNETQATKFFNINELYPELNISYLASLWGGQHYYLVFFEFYDNEGKVEHFLYTESKNIESFVSTFIREIEIIGKRKHYENYINNPKLYKKLLSMYEKHVNSNSNDASWTLRGKMRYLYFSRMISPDKLGEEYQKIKADIDNGAYNEDWREYGRFDGKWKSELLVFEHCQKMFGKENVLFQYSPTFLGQMSYDVYIISKNVAIEYQGKQHFEPVEFFGGQEHFEKQVVRDKLKKKLSKENGVKLVYINYDEVISEQLIKERIEEIS